MFQCQICAYQLKDMESFIKHLKQYHADDKNLNIPCGEPGCLNTFNNLSSRRAHISRNKHNTKSCTYRKEILSATSQNIAIKEAENLKSSDIQKCVEDVNDFHVEVNDNSCENLATECIDEACAINEVDLIESAKKK